MYKACFVNQYSQTKTMNKRLKTITIPILVCLLFGTTFAQPDLSIDRDRLIRDIRTDLLDNSNDCYINEGCITGFGARQLIKFTTHIRNVGNQDFVVGPPPSSPSLENEIWEWDECHGHWHYESYARYLLYDQNGNQTPAGFKNGFCLMDSECSNGGSFTYNCSYQGISAGCGDIYSWSLPCQWIDVTDIPSGVYRLVNQVNWLRSSDLFNNSEVNYSNNEASICIQISRSPNGQHLVNVLSDSNCDCTDNDSDGICATEDCNDNNPNLPATPGTNCNDNNSSTGNDVILTDGCTCQGTLINCPDVDGDGICANEDCNDNNPNLPATPGASCNDNNPITSNDVILADGCTCQGTSDNGETTISCGPLTITYGGGQIDMVGNSNYKFKIHDLNNDWNEVFSCATNCGGSQSVALPNGFYKIKIYNFDWSVLECDTDIMLTNSTETCPDSDGDGVCAAADCNDNNPSIPTTPGTPCSDNNSNTINDVILADGCTCQGTTNGGDSNGTTINCGEITIIYGNGQISMTGTNDSIYRFKIHDLNNGWLEVLNCATDDCGSTQTTSLPTGNYKIKIYNSSWVILCDQDINLSGGGACTDADGDGVCAAADCDDNNINLPATPGTGCNDNDSNTTNDVILADGCTCQGTNSNCVDSDDDGVCDSDDCAITNPNLPATPGSSCNDNNSNTSNDVILSDGCTCQGTTGGGSTGTCSDINITASATALDITGLTAPIEIIKIYRINNNNGWQLVFDCAANCGTQQAITNLTPGNYVVEAQFFTASWSSICSVQETLAVSSIDADNSNVPSFLIGNNNTANQHQKPIKFDLYPNPAQEKIWVNLSNWEGQILELKIVNHLAQVVVQYSINHQEGIVHPIEVPNLGNGLHFVQISNGTQTLTKKLFISK